MKMLSILMKIQSKYDYKKLNGIFGSYELLIAYIHRYMIMQHCCVKYLFFLVKIVGTSLYFPLSQKQQDYYQLHFFHKRSVLERNPVVFNDTKKILPITID